METYIYETYQKEKLEAFESVCRRCGACCGSEDGDPCSNLMRNPDGKYACKTYGNRLGVQKTVYGMIFNCVPIRDLIKDGALRETCAYNERMVSNV